MTVLLPVVLTVLASGLPLQSGQPGESATAAAETARVEEQRPQGDAGEAPGSLGRIQRALSRPPGIRLTGDRAVFRVEIIGRSPTIEDILGPDYLKGPVPYGGMTHREFLDMVTPKGVQGYAAFNNREAATVAATSLALQWALQKAIHHYQIAKHEREREAARREVQAALAELEKARLKAGLPPK
jgi:hypothetical protein